MVTVGGRLLIPVRTVPDPGAKRIRNKNSGRLAAASRPLFSREPDLEELSSGQPVSKFGRKPLLFPEVGF